MFELRDQRVHPGLDDKTLTSWNGLMIRGMAHAGRIMNKQDYIDSADKAAGFIYANLWTDNRLLATSKDGHAHLNAYLDDYAFLICGLIELLQARWDTKWLTWAQQLADVLIEQFEDVNNGGFFFTSHDHEQLIQRSKSYSDDATPSGNGIAAQGLLLLGYLLAEPRYIAAAERCLKAAWHSMNQAAISHCSLLEALDMLLDPPGIVILRGDRKELQHWMQPVGENYLPRLLVFAVPGDAEIPASMNDKTAADTPLAYVCTGMSCSPPINTFENWQELVQQHSAALRTTPI